MKGDKKEVKGEGSIRFHQGAKNKRGGIEEELVGTNFEDAALPSATLKKMVRHILKTIK